MLNTLVTILIPSYNSVEGLKTTVESLIDQTKIRGTRVLVLDYGSSDGSVQFSDYASSKYFRILKIETVNLEKKNPDFEIFTPYCLYLSPGSILKDPDFMIELLNLGSKTSKEIVYYLNESKNPLMSFFPHYFYGRNKIKIAGILGRKENLLYLLKRDAVDISSNFTLEGKNTRSLYMMLEAKKYKGLVYFSS